jgi:hydroxymethylglutaryl-CoA lyase
LDNGMTNPQSITVLEVSPRDGLQNEATPVTTDDKLTLIHRALAAGFKRIEVTSFVHPTRVPQMADAEAVCAGLPQRADVAYAALILNRRGYDRARATGRIQEVGMVVPASDTFGERNQGSTVDDAVAVGCEILRDAARRGLRATATIAVAFGCPFEGEVAAARVLDIARRLAEAGPVELALADTIGVGVPGQVLDLFGALRDSLGGIPLRAHFHNTRNTGIANAFAALTVGVETLDASIGGIGGCPFAPKATGNIATEDLIYMLDRMKIRHDGDLESVIETSHWLGGVLGKELPAMVSRAGGFPGSAAT